MSEQIGRKNFQPCVSDDLSHPMIVVRISGVDELQEENAAQTIIEVLDP